MKQPKYILLCKKPLVLEICTIYRRGSFREVL